MIVQYMYVDFVEKKDLLGQVGAVYQLSRVEHVVCVLFVCTLWSWWYSGTGTSVGRGRPPVRGVC